MVIFETVSSVSSPACKVSRGCYSVSTMNRVFRSFVATESTSIKQDWQKIWQPTVGEVLILNKQETPSSTNQKNSVY